MGFKTATGKAAEWGGVLIFWFVVIAAVVGIITAALH